MSTTLGKDQAFTILASYNGVKSFFFTELELNLGMAAYQLVKKNTNEKISFGMEINGRKYYYKLDKGIGLDKNFTQIVHLGVPLKNRNTKKCAEVTFDLVNYSKYIDKNIQINVKISQAEQKSIYDDNITCEEFTYANGSIRDNMILTRKIFNDRNTSSISYNLNELPPDLYVLFNFSLNTGKPVNENPIVFDLKADIVSTKTKIKKFKIKLVIHHVDGFDEFEKGRDLYNQLVLKEMLKERGLFHHLTSSFFNYWMPRSLFGNEFEYLSSYLTSSDMFLLNNKQVEYLRHGPKSERKSCFPTVPILKLNSFLKEKT